MLSGIYDMLNNLNQEQCDLLLSYHNADPEEKDNIIAKYNIINAFYWKIEKEIEEFYKENM